MQNYVMMHFFKRALIYHSIEKITLFLPRISADFKERRARRRRNAFQFQKVWIEKKYCKSRAGNGIIVNPYIISDDEKKNLLLVPFPAVSHVASLPYWQFEK